MFCKKRVLAGIFVISSVAIISCGEKKQESEDLIEAKPDVTMLAEASGTMEEEVKSTPKKTTAPISIEEDAEKEEITEKDDDIEDDIEVMIPVLRTIAEYISDGGSYDAEDETSYYEILYMLGNNCAYAYGDKLYKETDDKIEIRTMAMQNLSLVAFPDHDVVYDIPTKYKDLMQYNSDKDLYILVPSDEEDVSAEIKNTVKNQDRTYTVDLDLINNENYSITDKYEFILVKSEKVRLGANKSYEYAVKEVIKLTE